MIPPFRFLGLTETELVEIGSGGNTPGLRAKLVRSEQTGRR